MTEPYIDPLFAWQNVLTKVMHCLTVDMVECQRKNEEILWQMKLQTIEDHMRIIRMACNLYTVT